VEGYSAFEEIGRAAVPSALPPTGLLAPEKESRISITEMKCRVKGACYCETFMGDVFILGAGFSRAVAKEMPLLADLNDAVWSKVTVPTEKMFLRSFGGNIEMVLTYLSQSHPWMPEAENLRNRALFLDLASAVRDVLLDSMGKAAQRPCPEWLLSLIHCWETTQAQVITLNYDTLVESAARLCNQVYASGLLPDHYYPFPMTPIRREWDEFSFRGYVSDPPSFRFFKLHGSINWLYSGSVSSHAETVYYAALDHVWTPSLYHELGVTDKAPLIVPPIAEKVGYFQNPHVRGMWREAAVALKTARRVFCLGYSLPDLDITMRFFLNRNHPSHSTPFLLVDLLDLGAHFREILPENVFELDTQHTGPNDPIPTFVASLVTESGKLPE
jgi:hypothetical protein